MNNWVYAVTVFNGNLIVGGPFTTAGGMKAPSYRPLGLNIRNRRS